MTMACSTFKSFNTSGELNTSHLVSTMESNVKQGVLCDVASFVNSPIAARKLTMLPEVHQ